MRMERVMIFIDHNNFQISLNEYYKQLGTPTPAIDLILFAKELSTPHRLLMKVFLYTALSDRADNPTAYDSHSKFIDAMKYKPRVEVIVGYLAKRPIPNVNYNPSDPNSYIHVEKETDVNIAKDMITKAFYNAYDTAILVSGDRDYAPILQTLKDIGKNTEVVLIGNQRSKLETIADSFIKIDQNVFNKCLRS
jgi:uncharacterized LabA/DUF88 family protein